MVLGGVSVYNVYRIITTHCGTLAPQDWKVDI